MSAITTAILLAAGAGTRLRAAEPFKPLCKVGGKPLIDHAVEAMGAACIERVVIVTGYGADIIEAHLENTRWPILVETVRTPDWRLPNGVSALAAAPSLDDGPALLVMCDHLVDPLLYSRMRQAGAGPGLRLGIDKRLGHSWVDPDDVTRVLLDGNRITAIGKEMEPYNAYDTGVFAVGRAFFDALGDLEHPSITDAVRGLIRHDAAEAVDCSDLDWIDIDDMAALAKAEQWQRDTCDRGSAARAM